MTKRKGYIQSTPGPANLTGKNRPKGRAGNTTAATQAPQTASAEELRPQENEGEHYFFGADGGVHRTREGSISLAELIFNRWRPCRVVQGRDTRGNFQSLQATFLPEYRIALTNILLTSGEKINSIRMPR